MSPPLPPFCMSTYYHASGNILEAARLFPPLSCPFLFTHPLLVSHYLLLDQLRQQQGSQKTGPIHAQRGPTTLARQDIAHSIAIHCGMRLPKSPNELPRNPMVSHTHRERPRTPPPVRHGPAHSLPGAHQDSTTAKSGEEAGISLRQRRVRSSDNQQSGGWKTGKEK